MLRLSPDKGKCVRYITKEELLLVLERSDRKGAKNCALITATFPKLLKKCRLDGRECPFVGGVRKITLRAVTLGVNYEAAVNRARLREAEEYGGPEPDYFHAESLWGGAGEHVGTYGVRHRGTGKLYLAYKPRQSPDGSVISVQEEWQDVAKGNKIVDYAEVKDFLYTSNSTSDKQQLQIPLAWRVVALEHIVELRYGDVYNIVH
jgi:hypothetical protein